LKTGIKTAVDHEFEKIPEVRIPLNNLYNTGNNKS
jgi:hypothetical protein